MTAFRNNSRLFWLGNSFLGQLATTVVCNTEDAVVWSLEAEHGNSFLAYHPEANVTMMIVSNAPEILVRKPKETFAMLERIRYVPDYFVLGSLNHWNLPADVRTCNETRHYVGRFREWMLYQRYRNASPRSYVEIFDPDALTTDSDCCAEENCRPKRKDHPHWKSRHCHACLPGALNSKTEGFVRRILESSSSPSSASWQLSSSNTSAAVQEEPIRVFDDTVYLGFETPCDVTNKASEH